MKGSTLDDFLKEEGIYEECCLYAARQILIWRLKQILSQVQK